MVRVCVIGAGITGLSSATHIQDSIPHADVTIIAEKLSPFTTGDMSAGFWFFMMVGEGNKELWGQKTYQYVLNMSNGPLAGVVGAFRQFGYMIRDDGTQVEWDHVVQNFRPMTDDELAIYPGATGGAFFMTVGLQCSMYLPWLTNKFVGRGGKIIQKKVNKISEISHDYDIIVNCSGIGAHSLVGDNTIIPVRGQVFKVQAPWIKNFVVRNHVYILPGVDNVTVGGTFQHNDWNTDVDEKDSKTIWENCVRYFPAIKEAKIECTVSGLRPYRPKVRLELEHMTIENNTTIPVVHNYGHGGSGVTLFKGCAEEVANIVRSWTDRRLASSKL